MPKVKTGLLIDDKNLNSVSENIEKLGYKPHTYSPYYTLISPQLISQCHKRDIGVIPWTINEVEEIQKLILMGVDGITTDYPDRAIEIYEGLKLSKH